MKRYLNIFSAMAFAVVIAGCGKQTESAPQPIKDQGTQGGGAAVANACPLYFPTEGLCAQIAWTVGPTADAESSFDVSFWKKDTGSSTGPFTEPTAQVGSYIRMTCCGSISFPKVNKTADGKYSVTKVRFVPGSWEVFVQLKNGEKIEKQFVPVKLDE